MKKSQIGQIATEYIAGLFLVLTFLFGWKYDEKPIWKWFFDSFNQRQERYASNIQKIDMVDIKDNKKQGNSP